MLCTLVDFFSPFDKGIYIGLTITIFPFFGFFNGFVAARMYTFFNGSDWVKLGAVACTFLPITIGICFIFVDLLESIENDIHKILPAYEALTMFLFWLLVHVPFCVVGTAFGFYLTKIEAPTRVNRMPREPPKPY